MTVLLETQLRDVTELFCEGEPAALKDGLVWKTVCRTGTWKLSPLPGGKPLVIDEELFDDVIAAFDQGAWQHVTVPLSHQDLTHENTGFVRKLVKRADPLRPGEWLLRAGLDFTEPEIKGKVLRGTIANTSVGITLAGVTRTADKRFFPRVLKHVALTNKPWLDGLEPFGSAADAIAASLDEPVAYEFDYNIVPDSAYPPSGSVTAAGEVVWNADDDVEAVRSELDRQLSMYDIRPDGSIGTLDDLDSDGVVDAFEQHSAPHRDAEGDGVLIGDTAYIRGMGWDRILVGCYPTTGGMAEEYAWVAPFEITADGPSLSPAAEWTKVERSWQALSQDYPVIYDDWDVEIALSISDALLSGDEDQFRQLMLDWNPSLHPKWPGHTPGGKGGQFMSTKGILDRLGKNPSGSLNISFLTRGSDRIESLTAQHGSSNKTVSFTAKLKDGSSKSFEVPVTERAFDTARVIGALKEVDQGAAKVHGHGDARDGQPRPSVDPFLEALTTEAERDPTLHPPIKKGRVSTELLGSAAPGAGSRRPVPAGGYHNTQQKYSIGGTIDPKTGEVVGGKWLLDRKEMHDRAIAYYLKGKVAPPPGERRALFFAGGTASGKSTALKGQGIEPPNAVHIDPDELKRWIPEYQTAALARDRYASSMAHEESSAMAKRLYDEATKLGLNIIVDGTGNSGGTKFLEKLRKADAAGYEVSVFMVDAPTEVAVPRSVLRGHRTGRFVPLEIVRNTHSNVSKAHLTWRNDPVVKEWTLYSTATQGGPAVLMAKGGGGSTVVHDEPLYTEMLSKGGPDIASKALVGPNVSRSEKAPSAGAFVVVSADGSEQRFPSNKAGKAFIATRGGKLYREQGGKRLFVQATEARKSAVRISPTAVLDSATPEEKAALSRIGAQAGANSADALRFAAEVLQWRKSGQGTVPKAPAGVDEAAVYRELSIARTQQPGPGNPLERKRKVRVNVSKSAAGAVGAAKVANAQSQLAQAFKDWRDHTAFVRMGGYYLQKGRNTAGRAPQPGPRDRPRKAPWSDLVKRLYPDNLDFHKAAHADSPPQLVSNPIAPGGVALAPESRPVKGAETKFKPGVRVQFERAGKFLKGVVIGPSPGGGIHVRVAGQILTTPRNKLYLLSRDSGTLSDLDLAGHFTPELHPRGLKGTRIGGKFIRKLFDASENGNVIAVNEVAHTIEVTVQGGRKYHIEPAGAGKLRVITYDNSGRAIRSSIHTVASIAKDLPELKGLTGLIQKKVRGQRGLVGRSKGGIKVIAHYVDEPLAASHRDDRGGEQMGENENEDGVIELSQEQFQAKLDAAVAEGRKEVEIELSRQRAELREMRVDRRVRELEDDGHAPAVLKVARQIMLADDSSDEALTLSLGDAENPVEKKTSLSGAIEELLAAIPEESRSLTQGQTDIKARADVTGTGEKKTAAERAEEAWTDLHDGTATL